MELHKNAVFGIQFTSAAPPCERRDPCGLYSVQILEREGMRHVVRVYIGDGWVELSDRTTIDELIAIWQVLESRGDGLAKIIKAAEQLVIDPIARERFATEVHGLSPNTEKRVFETLQYVAAVLSLSGKSLLGFHNS